MGLGVQQSYLRTASCTPLEATHTRVNGQGGVTPTAVAFRNILGFRRLGQRLCPVVRVPRLLGRVPA
jgi:hypothetical protein